MKNIKKTLAIVSIGLLFPLFSMGQEIIEREYYENGQLKTLVHNNGSETIIINYYEDGQLKDRSTFIGLDREGVFQSWYANGKQNLTVCYSNNKPDGEWISYDENGRMIANAYFDNGKLQGGSMWGDDGRIMASR